MDKSNYIIPIFVPFYGCPHHCAFCDQNVITGSNGAEINVSARINEILATILAKKGNKKIEVGFYGGSFTGLPLNRQQELLMPARILKEKGMIDGIRLSTRPDYINDNILSFLHENRVTTVELGVQSFDESVLIAAGRGHSIKDSANAARLIKNSGFELGLQLMIGLPGDTRIKAIRSAIIAAALLPDFVRIYPAVVLKGTELARQYLEGIFLPWTLEQVIAVVKKMVYIFTQNQIPVIRIGLQDSRSLKEDSLLAGPYHPATGELVQAAIYLDMISYLIGREQYEKKCRLWVFCHPTAESKVRGQKNENLAKLKKKFPFLKILIKHSTEFPKEAIGITAACQQFPKNLLTKQEFVDLQRIYLLDKV